MSDGHYILDAEHRPVAVDLLTWARWFEDISNRRVAEDFTRFYRVSTVCLGLDHRWGGNGPPLIFETMIFERQTEVREVFGRLMPVQEEVDMWRYSSWDDALAGHAAALRRCQLAEEVKIDGHA